jgi:TolC family type I secretion outer membrane protein
MVARITRPRLALMLAVSVLVASPAAAESLKDALALAYQTNTSLIAARARLRGTDEQFIQARSVALPTITGTITAGTNDSIGHGLSGAITNPQTGQIIAGGASGSDSTQYSVSASQNLFRGGRTGAAMDAAMANIYSARAQLISTEQQILLSVVTAYVDVRRDAEILKISENNVHLLEAQLQATRDRFDVGEITRTDVSQAEARLADARSQFSAAQAQLTASRAAYEQVVGQAPGTLDQEPELPELPKDLDTAYALAMQDNPDVVSANYNDVAAKANVRNAKGAMYPSVSLSASASHLDSFPNSGPLQFDGDGGTNPVTGAPLPNVGRTDTTSVAARLSIPIFSGNALSSQLRQAKQTESSAKYTARDTERTVRSTVSRAWSSYLASAEQIKSTEESVRANELAYEGVEAEAQVGLRTTLDVLNAEQELLGAREALVQAQAAAYVAAYALLQAVGRVTPEYLGLGVQQYDPARNLSKIKRNILGIGAIE